MCKWGTIVHTEIDGKPVGIDACIFDLVDALNKGGIKTEASCCGHNNIPGNIVLKDGRVLVIHPDFDKWIKEQKHEVNIHGEKINNFIENKL